jgi:hypothetical protein
MDELSTVESGSNYSSRRDDDTVMSGRDQVLSSSSRFASPEDSKNKLRSSAESPMEIISEHKLPAGLGRKPPERLKDGFVVALRTRDNSGFHVSRERVAGGGWYLDIVSNASKRDPAAQFLITFKNRVVLIFPFFFALLFIYLSGSLLGCCTRTYACIYGRIYTLQDMMGLRSFVAGGKLLQVIIPFSVSTVFLEDNFRAEYSSTEIKDYTWCNYVHKLLNR